MRLRGQAGNLHQLNVAEMCFMVAKSYVIVTGINLNVDETYEMK